MNRSVAAIWVVSLFFACASLAPAENTTITAFKNVRALTMTEAGVVELATVTVDGSAIVSLAKGNGEVPEGARIIDGTGMTLMPGLADMHVHYWSSNEGPLFLANSVTTLRNMWGSSSVFTLDAGTKRGVLIGPHLYTPGPLMDGPEPIWGKGSMMLSSPEQAVGAVESQRTTGYRAIKLYEGLTPEIYAAAVQAAKDRDMQVYTHVPEGMSVEEVIGLGVDSIEHFDDVAESVYAGDEESPGYFTRWANADPDRMRTLADSSADAGVWHSPTFAVIAQRYEYGTDADAFFERPESAFVGTGLINWWRSSAARMGGFDAKKLAAVANQRAFLKMLYDAGAPLLIGTDTPNPFVLPGFAIHDELASFIEAGIPVEAVLRIATADAAKFLREEGEWGVIAEKARADLVLLDADPREDLTTLRRPVGVMVNGHWYDSDQLAAELNDIRERVAEQAARPTE